MVENGIPLCRRIVVPYGPNFRNIGVIPSGQRLHVNRFGPIRKQSGQIVGLFLEKGGAETRIVPVLMERY